MGSASRYASDVIADQTNPLNPFSGAFVITVPPADVMHIGFNLPLEMQDVPARAAQVRGGISGTEDNRALSDFHAAHLRRLLAVRGIQSRCLSGN